MSIIKLCGGVAAVSEMTGRDATRVRRWTYPKERGGSDGLIPADMQQVLMARAQERKIPLSPNHFFPMVADEMCGQDKGTQKADAPKGKQNLNGGVAP